jgi:hypothetical protein
MVAAVILKASRNACLSNSMEVVFAELSSE